MEWIKENRKIVIRIWIVVLILIFVISIILVKTYFDNNKVYGIQYQDTKDLEYIVGLKQNEYYDEQEIKSDNQYIASLIKYISANFKYNLQLEENYNYNYKIVANVNVVDDKTNKSIYQAEENILEEKTGKSDGSLNIDENVEIDYNKYNSLINEFVAMYDLRNITSTLSLNLYLGIEGIEKEFIKEDITVMTLDMPLTSTTISIDTNYNILGANNMLEISSDEQNSQNYLKSGLILMACDILLFGILIIYVKKSATDKDKYNMELRKITNNYDTYISKVEEEFNMEGYQILKVEKFTDLLEIRDTMHLPIIMVENKKQLVTCFLIPTTNNILYYYSIGVSKYALGDGKHVDHEKRIKDE